MCGEECISKVFSLRKGYQEYYVDGLMLHCLVLV